MMLQMTKWFTCVLMYLEVDCLYCNKLQIYISLRLTKRSKHCIFGSWSYHFFSLFRWYGLQSQIMFSPIVFLSFLWISFSLITKSETNSYFCTTEPPIIIILNIIGIIRLLTLFVLCALSFNLGCCSSYCINVN